VADFLHERRDFDQLLAVVANDRALDPMLVEKDYWTPSLTMKKCAAQAFGSFTHPAQPPSQV
jgi:hypothetical protein